MSKSYYIRADRTNPDLEFETLAKGRDPTLLSDISSQFNHCVSSLLSIPKLENIPEEQLRRFQSQYTQHAFRCRFTPCTGASLGFLTESMRASHEQLHVKRLFCDKPNCARGRIGFRLRRELNMHNKTYHTEGSILVPPRVRRVAPNASETPNREVSPLDTKAEPPEETLTPRTKGRWGVNKIEIPLDEDFRQLMSMEDALDRVQLSSPLKSKTVEDWGAIFNTRAKPAVDIHLQHILQHDSIVCSVGIDRHGRRLATGCNRTARIFNLQTGENLCYLQHQPPEVGECYVRSVCFSPDGTQLVTGSEDKLVRVRLYSILTKQHVKLIIRLALGLYLRDYCPHIFWSRAGRVCR